MQEQGKGKAKNKSKSKGGKAKAKAKGKANAGNVRDGSPQRELSDPWDDLRNAWAVEYLQSTQGSQVTHQNQNQNQQQNQQKRQKKQNNQNSHPKGQQSGSASAQNRRGRGNRAHAPKQQKQQKKNPNPNPNGQQSESASAQKRRGRGEGGHVHAGQKRKTTESVTNDITDTDDADRGRAPKRHKSERRPQPPPSPSPSSPEPGAAARPHPDFWHPDGSVIIQIERTKFRLHQSMLKRDSAYFATVFQKGSHKHGGRAYLEVEVDERSPNGHHLPVYRIAETTANDFATLLSVMEGNWCVLYYRCFSFSPAPRLLGKIAIAYCTFFACVLINILGNTQMIPHQCLSWLVFSVQRALLLLKCNVNGRSVSSSECGLRRWILSQWTQSHMQLSHLRSHAPAVCVVSRSAQVTSYYGCRRSGKPSSQLPQLMWRWRETHVRMWIWARTSCLGRTC